MKEDFRETAQTMEDNIPEMELVTVIDDSELTVGDYLTAQQRKRDKQITLLLKAYVDAYCNKMKNRGKQRGWIIAICGVIIAVMLFCCVFATVTLLKREEMDIAALATLITAYISGFGGVGFVVKTVAQYLFPADEEQYITQIVKLIQENDLENKKLNVEMEKEQKKTK